LTYNGSPGSTHIFGGVFGATGSGAGEFNGMNPIANNGKMQRKIANHALSSHIFRLDLRKNGNVRFQSTLGQFRLDEFNSALVTAYNQVNYGLPPANMGYFLFVLFIVTEIEEGTIITNGKQFRFDLIGGNFRGGANHGTANTVPGVDLISHIG
jgi:hypothetical protein